MKNNIKESNSIEKNNTLEKFIEKYFRESDSSISSKELIKTLGGTIDLFIVFNTQGYGGSLEDWESGAYYDEVDKLSEEQKQAYTEIVKKVIIDSNHFEEIVEVKKEFKYYKVVVVEGDGPYTVWSNEEELLKAVKG